MRRLPIRIRLVLLASLAGLVASLVVAGVALWREGRIARSELDVFLSQEASEAIALTNSGGRFAHLVDVNSSLGPTQRLALLTPDGAVVDATAVVPPIPDLRQRASRYETLADPIDERLMRTIVVPFTFQREPLVLVVSTPLAYTRERMWAAARTMAPLVTAAVAAIAFGSAVLTRSVLRPFDQLTQSALALARNPRGRRLDVPGADDEIRALAETLNDALEAVDAAVDSQREFVARASHELRSPLARLAADLELAQRPTRTREEIDARLAKVAMHAGELTTIADNLLDLLEDRVAAPSEHVTLGRVLAAIRSQVEGRQALRIHFNEHVSETPVICDVGQIAGAVRNLVDNAFIHGREPVRLSIAVEQGVIDFTVEDAGPGMPAGMTAELRRPFARGPRTTTAEPGAGLGLAVVVHAAELHSGSLDISEEGPSRVSLRIPLIPQG